ncbi:MAG TPA: hypothetical protein VJ901_16050 [Thermoanaerobaculia bacterium]|nr:hypothetical protein [Thermoanaerobaculia bacterium]
MNDFRGPLPLTDRDFAAVRAKVLSAVEKRRGRLSYMPALAATAVVLLVLLVMPRQDVEPMKPLPPPKVHVVVAPQPAPAPIAEALSSSSKEPVAATHDCACDVTMNITTADPDVRIIWIGR